jgi:hypothetical protein
MVGAPLFASKRKMVVRKASKVRSGLGALSLTVAGQRRIFTGLQRTIEPICRFEITGRKGEMSISGGWKIAHHNR